MPNTSTCPKCEERITLVDAPEASLVECPHCQEQFELAEALDFVAEADEDDCPPEVILVEIREAEEASEIEEASEEAGIEEEEAPQDPPVQVRCPCCRDSFALEDLLLAETDEPLGVDAASAILSDGTIREQDGPRFHFGGNQDADDHSGFRLESVEEREPASAEAFEFATPVGGDTNGADGAAAPQARRRRRERGGMKDMLGAIFGGAAGLLITYYLLNLIGGPRFDMFDIYLPFVKHTAVHRPWFLGGPPEEEEEEFDSGIGDVVSEETPEPASKPKPKDKENDAPMVEEPTEDASDVPLPPEEDPLPPDYVGLISPPQVTSEQLGQALREVDRLAKAGPMDEDGYEAWCRVAETATFVDRKAGDPQTQNRLDAVRRLMKDLPEYVPKIDHFATGRIIDPDRGNNGLLCAGTVRNANIQKGRAYITGLVVSGTDAKVVIASDRKLPIQPNDNILVLGYVVDQPKEAIQGLDTELPQITWVRTVLKFE